MARCHIVWDNCLLRVFNYYFLWAMLLFPLRRGHSLAGGNVDTRLVEFLREPVPHPYELLLWHLRSHMVALAVLPHVVFERAVEKYCATFREEGGVGVAAGVITPTHWFSGSTAVLAAGLLCRW